MGCEDLLNTLLIDKQYDLIIIVHFFYSRETLEWDKSKKYHPIYILDSDLDCY